MIPYPDSYSYPTYPLTGNCPNCGQYHPSVSGCPNIYIPQPTFSQSYRIDRSNWYHPSLEYLINCDRCKEAEAEIFNDQGDFCVDCWQQATTPV